MDPVVVRTRCTEIIGDVGFMWSFAPFYSIVADAGTRDFSTRPIKAIAALKTKRVTVGNESAPTSMSALRGAPRGMYE